MGERIYCHPQTDCFILSELFSVARPAGRSKPGSKPVQLYDRLRLQTTIGLMSRVFANGSGDQGSHPGRVILKIKKNGTWCGFA